MSRVPHAVDASALDERTYAIRDCRLSPNVIATRIAAASGTSTVQSKGDPAGDRPDRDEHDRQRRRQALHERADEDQGCTPAEEDNPEDAFARVP